MGITFWIKRFLVVAACAFVVIGSAQVFRGRELDDAALHGAMWAVISAAVFTVARFVQSRRGQHCAICKDTPETALNRPAGEV